MLGHGKKATEQQALTSKSWRPQREGLIRAQRESDQVMGTHELETTEGGTCQNMERKQLSNGHSLPGYSRERDLSGHGEKMTKQQALTSWRQQEGLVRTQKKSD